MSAVTFDAAVAPLVRHMQLVDRHRESLQRLQDIWDQLALLGRMSNVATDIGDTAEEFRALGGALLDSLAQRLLANTMHRMRAQAQVAIDILVRNLFERTADVGFLATDNAVCEFLRVAAAGDPTQTEHRRVQLQARFEAYVAKYSVYDDVIVLAPDGSVRARLDDGVAAGRCGHRLVSDTLRGDAPFVESFGAIDVLGGRRGLVYSAAIRDPGTREVLGVLCLSFRFDDEMKSIFTHLAPVGPCSVVALRDAKGAVLASSDVWQLPQGAVMAPAGPWRDRVFFAGREYLITSVAATGYQGYAGPGWSACTLVPLDQAFRDEHDELDPHDGAGQGAAPVSLPPGALNDGSLFSQELRSIPLQARRIQRGLKRLVWNGEVRGRQAADRSAGGFGAALLQQITATGERITRVIEAAIGDLQQSAAAAFLDEARSCSALAIDIMDRNLYERANDCRWWALDAALQRALGGNAGASAVADASRVLAHINSLYTVYSSLLLLDAQGQVVAASNAAGQAWVGQRPDAPWVQLALQLRDGQAYVCSPFEASPLYDGRMTCVYAGAVRSDAGVGAALGAVAVVFDSEPQFEAMLRDTLPRDATGQVLSQAVGLFATRAGMIVSSTDTVAFPIGQALAFQQLRQELALLARGESRQVVLELDGSVYAVGVTMSRGYREYNNHAGLHDDDVACMVLVRLGAQQAGGDAVVQAEPAPLHTLPAGPRGPHGPNGSSQWRQLASFYCAGDWLALDAGGVVEAIHAAQLKMLPGSPAWMAGVMMCGDEAVPVVDLRALRNMAPRAANGEPVPVILCKNSGQATFGLRVDDLGQVMEIAPSAVHPLVGRLAAHDRHAEGVLSFGDAKARHMLTVLNLDRLASGLALRA